MLFFRLTQDPDRDVEIGGSLSGYFLAAKTIEDALEEIKNEGLLDKYKDKSWAIFDGASVKNESGGAYFVASLVICFRDSKDEAGFIEFRIGPTLIHSQGFY